MDLFEQIKVGGQTLTCTVKLEPAVEQLAAAADYTFTGRSEFVVPSFTPPQDFTLGVIVGPSGSGKSSLLRAFGDAPSFAWDEGRAVSAQVDPKMLMRLGLASIPSLCRPFHVLSEGEKHRAVIARTLAEGARVIDEFTSVVHRDLAQSISMGLRRVVDAVGTRGLVLATCHEDVVEWLCPDWVFYTSTGRLVDGRSVRQPVHIDIMACSTQVWSIFAPHHYLDGGIAKSAWCWLAVKDGRPCAFTSVLPLVGATPNCYRGHRTVVLPDFQGMGIGSRLSEAVAQVFVDAGGRFFSKTAHPAFGQYRNASPKWRATAHNDKTRTDLYATLQGKHQTGYVRSLAFISKHIKRHCYAHEYIGDGTGEHRRERAARDHAQLALY